MKSILYLLCNYITVLVLRNQRYNFGVKLAIKKSGFIFRECFREVS